MIRKEKSGPFAKKGQAAMEFLMTYGWAILAAVIVIGVLASFGVFSSKNVIPTTCTINAPFGCDKNQVDASEASNSIRLVIRNGAGQTEIVSSIDIAGCGIYTPAGGLTMADQNTTLVTIGPCTPVLVEDDKFNGDVTVTYRPQGGTLDAISSGSVTVTVGP